MDTNENTQIEPKMVQVLVRLERREIDELKAETGATADATAVSCFIRKNLNKAK